MSPESTKSSIQHDLRDARALLEEIGSDEERKKYRKAAGIILIKATRLDPENEEAKILLESVRDILAPSLSGVPQPRQPQQPQRLRQSDDPSLTVPTLFRNLGHEEKNSRSKVLFGLIAVLVIGFGIIGIHGMSPSSAASSPVTRTPTAGQKALPRPPVPDTPAAGQQSNAPAAPIAAAPETPQPVHTPDASPETAAAPSSKAPTGKLEVTSSTPAEIYQGNKRLGLTPMTLQLPVGRQTLEYRLGNLRTLVSHDIKAGRTTSATVTFQTTIQINAKPWAQVFVDGAQRRALGQTPLSGISVPVGSVLVFENPNFLSKTRRVTENDRAIQMDFE